MVRRWSCLIAAMLLGAGPSMVGAQSSGPSMSPYDPTAAGDTITPKNITIFGGSEQVARDMLVAMRLERRERDLCWEIGCVVIVNESKNYAVTAFNVDGGTRSGKAGWGHNQLRTPLAAMKATYRLKLDEKEDCVLPVQFVLRQVATGEEITVEGRTDLCRSPQRVSMIRLKVVTPTVTVGDEPPQRTP